MDVLTVRDLVTNFHTYEGVVKALDGIGFEIKKGETLGLVGETGCGKSVTVLSIMRLIRPPGKIERGEALYQKGKGEGSVDLFLEKEGDMREIRGNEISMIFQEPSNTLNPVLNINYQLSEVFLIHRKRELYQSVIDDLSHEISHGKGGLRKLYLNIYKKMIDKPNSLSIKLLSAVPGIRRYKLRLRDKAREWSIDMLGKLGIPGPDEVVDRYPHELSGGMQQRVVIAMALACNPSLLIADEPTSNLDVTIQAQILDLMRDLKKRFGTSILFITHDLGVVAEMCDRVAIMYAGNICEMADMRDIFHNPIHPYTEALLNAVPVIGKEKLESIKGAVPNLVHPPSGCRFHPRCPMAIDICEKEKPELCEVRKGHFVACHVRGK